MELYVGGRYRYKGVWSMVYRITAIAPKTVSLFNETWGQESAQYYPKENMADTHWTEEDEFLNWARKVRNESVE